MLIVSDQYSIDSLLFQHSLQFRIKHNLIRPLVYCFNFLFPTLIPHIPKHAQLVHSHDNKQCLVVSTSEQKGHKDDLATLHLSKYLLIVGRQYEHTFQRKCLTYLWWNICYPRAFPNVLAHYVWSRCPIISFQNLSTIRNL